MTLPNFEMLSQLNTNRDCIETRSDLIQQLEQKGAFYDVQLVDNYWYDSSKFEEDDMGFQETGKKTVVNMDLMKSIGVVSASYVPVLNQEIFEKFNVVLENCEDINLDGAYTEVQTSHDGARIMVEYVLPAHTVTLMNGDEVALRITALNSFDGSTGFKVYCGGIRFKCMNGMVLGDMMATYHAKHSAGLCLDSAAKVIETGLTAYLQGVDTWNAQIKTEVDGSTVFHALAEMAGIKEHAMFDTIVDYNAYREKQNGGHPPRKVLIDSYFEVYRDYSNELGSTQWAVNNALTHISTHGVRDSKPSIQSQTNKAELAVKLIKKYLTSTED